MKNLKLNQERKKLCFNHSFLKIKFLVLLLIATASGLFISCQDELEVQAAANSNEQEKNITARLGNGIQIVDGIIEFSDSQTLHKMGNDYKNSVAGQNEFNDLIRELQSKGFKSLTPIFGEKDTERIKDFLQHKRERLIQLEVDLGIKNQIYSTSDIKLEDEIIADPFFSALLNENREIIVGDVFYKYTELGLYYCNKEQKNVLFDYLENLTPTDRISIITKNRSLVGIKGGKNEFTESVRDGISHFVCKIVPDDPGDGGSGGGGGSGYIPPTPAILNVLSLPICAVDEQGFFEGFFGASEDCYVHYSNNRRTKTSFWNQNYHIYSAIGSSISLEKRNVIRFFMWSTVYWDNSFADKIELGVNTISYKYNFNVSMFNQALYNYSTTFFEYNGTKYNVNGQVIPTVPTSNGNFVFDTNSNQSVIDITVLGYNLQLNNGQVNSYIDQALNQLISQINAYDVRQELANKKATGQLKVNILYAVPFANDVKFFTANVAWRENNSHRIVHYFDFNFLFTWNNGYSGYGDYLNGLNGATDYTEVKADIYGAALHNNEWRGSRLTYVD